MKIFVDRVITYLGTTDLSNERFGYAMYLFVHSLEVYGSISFLPNFVFNDSFIGRFEWKA